MMALTCSYCLETLAADWPQLRGPNGSGVSDTTGLPVRFGPEQNVIWKVALPSGHSSPILVKDRIFLTGFKNGKLLTICLSRSTGKILWQRECPRDRVEKYYEPYNTPASPTPVSDGENVYAFFADFGLISYDLDGNDLWRVPLGPFNNVNGHASSPITVGDKVVMLCDQDTGSYLLALDKKSGRVQWKVERPEVTRGYATPGVYQPIEGAAELIVPGAYQLVSYSVESGEKLWWVHGLAWQAKSVPLVDGNRIYVNSWESEGDRTRSSEDELPTFKAMLAKYDKNNDGKLSRQEYPKPENPEYWDEQDLDKNGYFDPRDWNYYRARRLSQNSLLAIRHGGSGDLTEKNVVWRYSKSLPNVPSPLLYRNVLYLVRDGGIVTTLDPGTGQVLKQGRLKGAVEEYYASPVAGDGKVFMLSMGGKLSVLKATGDWDVLAMNDLDEECFATPAIADGRIYIRTRNLLFCYGK